MRYSVIRRIALSTPNGLVDNSIVRSIRGPAPLRPRTAEWFFPRARWSRIVFVVAVLLTTLLVGACTAPHASETAWFAIGGAAAVAWGATYRYVPILEPWARRLSAQELAIVQDARGRGVSLVGMVMLVGSLLALPLVIAFP
jgi:hypothetical protein